MIIEENVESDTKLWGVAGSGRKQRELLVNGRKWWLLALVGAFKAPIECQMIYRFMCGKFLYLNCAHMLSALNVKSELIIFKQYFILVLYYSGFMLSGT